MSKQAHISKCDACGAIGTAYDGIFSFDEHEFWLVRCAVCGGVANAKTRAQFDVSLSGPMIPTMDSPFCYGFRFHVWLPIRNWIRQVIRRREYARSGPTQVPNKDKPDKRTE